MFYNTLFENSTFKYPCFAGMGITGKAAPLLSPSDINLMWSTDFMHDPLAYGRSMSLDQVIEWRGKPQAIHCDNDPECISAVLATCTEVGYSYRFH
jgi:hypothetical protein